MRLDVGIDLLASTGTPCPRVSRVRLQFIVVNTRKETVIDCEMAEDRQEIFFNFSAPFEVRRHTCTHPI